MIITVSKKTSYDVTCSFGALRMLKYPKIDMGKSPVNHTTLIDYYFP